MAVSYEDFYMLIGLSALASYPRLVLAATRYLNSGSLRDTVSSISSCQILPGSTPGMAGSATNLISAFALDWHSGFPGWGSDAVLAFFRWMYLLSSSQVRGCLAHGKWSGYEIDAARQT